MDQLTLSCDRALEYPKNLVHCTIYEHTLNAFFHQLSEQESRLFQIDNDVSLDFWEFDDQGKAFWPTCIRNTSDLKRQLQITDQSRRKDPRCRFIFVHSRHSREKLRVTRETLMLTLTYHQVMPAFLDFLFPFGKQHYAQDFNFSGFRYENCLTEFNRGLSIPELGWSGRDIRMCYNLKSVEPSESDPDWPWSVRQTAVHHSFDVDNGRATWIVIKGNQLMKKRIKLSTESLGLPELSSFQTVDRCFAASLATHLILCDWSADNWRWYINFLEETLQKSTRHILSAMIDRPPKLVVQRNPFLTPQPTLSSLDDMMSNPKSEKRPLSPSNSIRGLSSSLPFSPSAPPELPFEFQGSDEVESPRDFYFSDLQRLQSIEEKSNEALLVLKHNVDTLGDLKQHYRSLMDCEAWPEELTQSCREDATRFEDCVRNAENTLRIQQSRVETMLRILATRKSLLYGILEYRNVEASKLLTKKAQISSDNMETITRDMHDIAQKTKQETVSMRVITLVTLFFLPGTFISTLMSTDIVRFRTNESGLSENSVQLGALQLYITISLPLMVITFLAWYGVYWWVNRKERLRLRGAASRFKA